RKQKAPRAAAAGYSRSPGTLSAPRKATDQLPCFVHFPERSTTRSARDRGRPPLAFSSSSSAQSNPSCQPAPSEAHLWGGYGAGRDVPACLATADGPLANRDHHALRRTHPAGRLARIRPRHREAQGVGLLPPLMTPGQSNLEQIFETQIRTLALTLRPSTVDDYRCTARHFRSYLRATCPQLRRLPQLRRDPHLLGWFRWLREQEPPLSNPTRTNRLIRLRRLLDDLAANGHPVQSDLI